MQEIVEELRRFFTQVYQSTVVPDIESRTGQEFDDLPEEKKPAIGLAVGGFSTGAFLSEVWQILIPLHDTPDSAKRKRGEGEFGSTWFALFEPIRRYMKGYDLGLLNALKQHVAQFRGAPLSPQENATIDQTVAQYEYRIPFPAMPIEEGIAHVKFLVEMVINHHRFALGAPIVGGEARIGLVTYKGEKFKILEGD